MKDVLTYKGFIGSVHFSTDDRVFFGKIEGIHDLVTFEGTTVDELENAFKSMVEEHMKDCKAEGKSAEKSYKGSFNVRIGTDLHRQAAQIASIEGITLNQLVQRAIQRELETGN
jgi:predicted HicB family RNase H-like nuclease